MSYVVEKCHKILEEIEESFQTFFGFFTTARAQCAPNLRSALNALKHFYVRTRWQKSLVSLSLKINEFGVLMSGKSGPIRRVKG